MNLFREGNRNCFVYYFRSLGLQLASFETKEKADSITTYLTNAGEWTTFVESAYTF